MSSAMRRSRRRRRRRNHCLAPSYVGSSVRSFVYGFTMRFVTAIAATTATDTCRRRFSLVHFVRSFESFVNRLLLLTKQRATLPANRALAMRLQLRQSIDRTKLSCHNEQRTTNNTINSRRQVWPAAICATTTSGCRYVVTDETSMSFCFDFEFEFVYLIRCRRISSTIPTHTPISTWYRNKDNDLSFVRCSSRDCVRSTTNNRNRRSSCCPSMPTSRSNRCSNDRQLCASLCSNIGAFSI